MQLHIAWYDHAVKQKLQPLQLHDAAVGFSREPVPAVVMYTTTAYTCHMCKESHVQAVT